MRSAALLFTDNGFYSPQSIALNGVGNANADVAVSLGVTQGGSRTFTYTATIKNAGPATAAGVWLSTDIPAGTRFSSATVSQGSCVTPAPGAVGAVSCTFGNLASGAQATLMVLVDVQATGKTDITTSVSTGASSPDPNMNNNSVTLVAHWGGPK
jgi:uncharacterized repeat protein (TIGR01451 family)